MNLNDELMDVAEIDVETLRLVLAIPFSDEPKGPQGRFMIHAPQSREYQITPTHRAAPLTFDLYLKDSHTDRMFQFVLTVDLFGNGPVLNLVGRQAFLEEVYHKVCQVCAEVDVTFVDLAPIGDPLLGLNHNVNDDDIEEDPKEEYLELPFFNRDTEEGNLAPKVRYYYRHIDGVGSVICPLEIAG